MNDIQVLEHLLHKLQDEIDKISDALLHNRMRNMEEYQFQTGRASGFLYAISHIKQTMNHIIKDEDDADF